MSDNTRYYVDGHEFPNEESGLLGDGKFPPFRVFDIEAQDYLPGTYPTRVEAETVKTVVERIGRFAALTAAERKALRSAIIAWQSKHGATGTRYRKPTDKSKSLAALYAELG